MTKYDPETGLPQLPDTMRWVVAREEIGFRDTVVLRLEDSYQSIFGKTKWIYKYGESLSTKLVNATYIKEASERILERWAHDERIKSLLGEYPPKRLG